METKSVIGLFLIFISIIIAIVSTIFYINQNWKWQNDYFNYWQLSDKASTISQKSEYVDKFVEALDKSGLQGTNANLIWQTQNTSFDQNMSALKSLQTRLQEIKSMDETSFAYQTAIQQITDQEQGQASEMLSVLESCWWKVHCPIFWNLYGFIYWAIVVLIGCFGIGLMVYDNYK